MPLSLATTSGIRHFVCVCVCVCHVSYREWGMSPIPLIPGGPIGPKKSLRTGPGTIRKRLVVQIGVSVPRYKELSDASLMVQKLENGAELCRMLHLQRYFTPGTKIHRFLCGTCTIGEVQEGKYWYKWKFVYVIVLIWDYPSIPNLLLGSFSTAGNSSVKWG
jgi:hypothetical protein